MICTQEQKENDLYKTTYLENWLSCALSHKDLETIIFNDSDANGNVVAHILQIQELFKYYGLKFPFFPRREKDCGKMQSKYESSLHGLLFFYFGKGRSILQSTNKSQATVCVCLFFSNILF